MVRIELGDHLSFPLQEPHRFSWISALGTVSCVFADQDSGNLAFGIQAGGQRLFVKYAGARPMAYTGQPEEAIWRLKQAARTYQDLTHPDLITLRDFFAVGSGYALIFDWCEGESLHAPSEFPPPAKYTDPRSPTFRFRQLPISLRLRCLDTVFKFHAHVEAKDYVAIDFYDGSLLYDFATHTTTICDIDFYQKKPVINTMGRIWGSSRFMSPEEYQPNAPIDARTNVFTMGATAFALLGGETDRSHSRWDASDALYRVALRAVSPARTARFATVAEFYQAWCHASLAT